MTIEFRIFIAAPSEVEEQRKAVFDVVATIARWVESPTTLPHWVPQVLGDVTQEKTRRSAVAKAVGTLICASGGSRSHGEPPAGPGRGPASRRGLTKFSRDREKGWNTPWQDLVGGRKDIPTSTRSHLARTGVALSAPALALDWSAERFVGRPNTEQNGRGGVYPPGAGVTSIQVALSSQPGSAGLGSFTSWLNSTCPMPDAVSCSLSEIAQPMLSWSADAVPAPRTCRR